MERDGTEDQNNEYHNNLPRCLVYVHPSQYERILKRREERTRTMERRGRPMPVHLPIIPIDSPQNYIQYQNNGMLYDQYGNCIIPNVPANYMTPINGGVNGYVNDPRNAIMNGVNMNAMNYAQAMYYNQLYQNIMYNRYYGYRGCNGYPMVPNTYMTVRRLGPYHRGPNGNTEARPTNVRRSSNMSTDNVNKNGTPHQLMNQDPPLQRDTLARYDQVPTQNQDFSRQYYTIVSRTPDAMNMDLRMESNTTEAMESATESNSSGTMDPGMVPITTENMTTYMAPNSSEMIDPNMFPNAAQGMDPNMLATSSRIMEPMEQLNGVGTMPAYVNPNISPSMIPHMAPNMAPINSAALTPRMGPGVPNVFATIGYKMASDFFASIASTLTSDLGPNGGTMVSNVQTNVPPNTEAREIPNAPPMMQNRTLNEKPQENMNLQSAPNAIGTIDPNTAPGAPGTIDPRMMPNTVENMEPSMPIHTGPNAMEAMRAYLGPDSASNLAKYMVKNMVPCPYTTIDSVHPLNTKNRSHPYNPDVRQKPCKTNVTKNTNVNSKNVTGNDVVSNTNVTTNNDVATNNDVVTNNTNVETNNVTTNANVTGNNDELNVVNDPQERRRRPRVNRRNGSGGVRRGNRRTTGNTRNTNRRTNRTSNRNGRRNANRSNSSNTLAGTLCFDNGATPENGEDNENCSSKTREARRELRLIANPESGTSLGQLVPSTRTIVDVEQDGLVTEANEDDQTTVKRKIGEVRTESTMSTVAENVDHYNFVAACAILEELAARERGLITKKRAGTRPVYRENAGVSNQVNFQSQYNMEQLVGNFPFEDFRTDSDFFLSYHHMPTIRGEIVHDYLYGHYLVELQRLWNRQAEDNFPVPAPLQRNGNIVYRNTTSFENRSSENNTNIQSNSSMDNTNSENKGTTENNTSTSNNTSIENTTSTSNNTSIENTSNTSKNTSIENITNTSNKTSIDNTTNTSSTSNNTSIENSTEVDNNATNWNNTNAGNNAQDYHYASAQNNAQGYYYANAGTNEAGYYQGNPGMTPEDYYYLHAWNVANINYETACALVASEGNLGKPKARKPRQTRARNEQKPSTRRSTKKAQKSDVSITNANQSKDNEHDHHVNGGESLTGTTLSETAQLYRELYECFEEDKNHQK